MLVRVGKNAVTSVEEHGFSRALPKLILSGFSRCGTNLD